MYCRYWTYSMFKKISEMFQQNDRYNANELTFQKMWHLLTISLLLIDGLAEEGQWNVKSKIYKTQPHSITDFRQCIINEYRYVITEKLQNVRKHFKQISKKGMLIYGYTILCIIPHFKVIIIKDLKNGFFIQKNDKISLKSWQKILFFNIDSLPTSKRIFSKNYWIKFENPRNVENRIGWPLITWPLIAFKILEATLLPPRIENMRKSFSTRNKNC